MIERKSTIRKNSSRVWQPADFKGGQKLLKMLMVNYREMNKIFYLENMNCKH